MPAKQSETQTEHAAKSTTDNTLPPNTTQTQVGPVRCCSNQADNPNDTLDINQESTQNNDTHQTQTNNLQVDCSTSGECDAKQTTTVDGSTTVNDPPPGSDVSTSVNCTGSTCTTPTITFDGSPGTGPPPSTLGPYTMTPFGPDDRALGGSVSTVPDPAGTIGFTPALKHDRIGQGWATWSHEYTGDVYDTTGAADKTQATITLPAGTNAFYFYAEPQQFALLTIQATAQDGTTSGPVEVQGQAGAQYFGFYGTGGATLSSITVATDDPTGFAVGEFGIAQ
jgi:hypothetical protein